MEFNQSTNNENTLMANTQVSGSFDQSDIEKKIEL